MYSASNPESLDGTYSLNGLVSEYLSPKFVKHDGTRYSLIIRDSVNKLVVPFHGTNYLKKHL